MPRILTLTMNPALDVATAIDRVVPDHKLRCGAAVTHPGGGGINVARVVRRLGGDVLALYPAGGTHGSTLSRLLDDERVPRRAVPIAGDTRESLAVHEASTGHDYRFVLPGPTLQAAEWQACLDAIDAIVATPPAPRMVVLSGSLPPGVPVDFHARVARAASARGCRVVLDSSGPALAAALQAGVYLVKPSLRELQDLVGHPLPEPADQLAACRQLIGSGQAQVVALTLGADGALLVSADQAWRAQALRVPVASTIGAGDSFVGGLVWALDQPPAAGLDLAEAFRWAMASSVAALASAGTALCDVADVRRLLAQIEIAAQ
ncbi:1-phosphofructokinase family hexose kinase [Aquabacterium sp.]|uniref:1-phosphofructokinase family hexose kinase n=1 Tax=Aquabacterium sp. TaxID=1872578 RepID=UPI0035AF760A